MEQLGIDAKLLLAQVVNFAIIFFILAKLLYKPILSILEKRKKEIEEGLTLTEKMRQENIKLHEKSEQILDKARLESSKIIEEAKERGIEKEKEIIEEARKEAQDIVQKGKDDVRQLRESMEKDIQKQAVMLAVAMSKRLLGRILNTKDHHEILEEQVKKLESYKK